MTETLAELVRIFMEQPQNTKRLPPDASYKEHFVQTICIKALNGDRSCIELVRELAEDRAMQELPGATPAEVLEDYEKVYGISINLPQDQKDGFANANYIPQPKQLLFHALCRKCDVGGLSEIAFGGARGPGKSHAMLAQMALDDCQRREGLKALILRRVGKAVRESFEDLRLKVLKYTPHNYNRSTGTLTFPNGSRIILGHFKDERDVDNYLGLEYDVIGVEEATTLSLSKYKAIRTCCRTSRDDWQPRIYLNANPGGVGHDWFKRRFISEAGQPRFVAATYRDNAFLNPGYVETLDDLTGWLKRAWRDGDWDIMAGQYYSNWLPEVHVVKPFDLRYEEWTFSVAMDYGWQHPTVALVFAEAAGGDVFVVAEYGGSKRLPESHSTEMQGMLDRVGIRRDWLRTVLIGGDAFRTDRDGKSVADEYQRLGWRLESAHMDRIVGATEILRRLGEPPDIRPSLFIFDTCPALISQLPAMQHDPRRPEDVLKTDADDDGYGGDDYYDALRYGLMGLADSRARTVTFETVWLPR